MCARREQKGVSATDAQKLNCTCPDARGAPLPYIKCGGTLLGNTFATPNAFIEGTHLVTVIIVSISNSFKTQAHIDVSV